MVTVTDVLVALLGALVLDALVLLRRLFDVAYTPLYFAFLPLRSLNSDLSIYLGDDFVSGGEDVRRMSRNERERLRTQIVFRGALASAVSAVALPAVAGFIAALFMRPGSLGIAVALVLASQGMRVLASLRDFGTHATHADSQTMNRLRLVYAVYFLVVVVVYSNVYQWTRPYVVNGDFATLTNALLELFVVRLVLTGILFSFLSASFLQWITRPDGPQLDEGRGANEDGPDK